MDGIFLFSNAKCLGLLSEIEEYLQTISDIDFLILIPSAPENLDLRRRIRDTWASSSTIFHRRQIYFFIGLSTNSQIQNKIFKENGAFKDIIQPGTMLKSENRSIYTQTSI